mmetsp:Transcript_7544/g.17255  ORF Transcript_7544/g.17255 Transcript_7544/m.17255 type:complete len:429 (-) Transcript_7544:90-1376(-)
MATIVPNANTETAPLLHDYEDRKMGELEAFMAVTKGFIGAAILAMPYAVRNSGILGMLFAVVMVALTINCTLKYLVQIKRKLTQVRIENGGTTDLSYPELAFEVWGHWSRGVVVGALVMAQLGCCCAYHIFISRSVEGIIHEVTSYKGHATYWITVLILFPIFLAFCLSAQHRMRNLVPLAALGNLVQILMLVLIVCYSYYIKCQTGDNCGRMELLELETVPMTLGIAAFAMEGIFPVLPLEHAMAEPAKFGRVLDFAVAIAAALCLSFGMAANYIFGPDTKAVITLNIGGPAGHAAKVGIGLALLVSYPLQMYPIIQWLDNLIREHQDESPYLLWMQRGCVVVLCLFSMVIALVFPHFGNILSLVGCIGFCLGGIVMPPLLFFRTFKDGLNTRDKVMVPLLVLFGSFILVAGTWSNIHAVMSGRAST